jgi:hypothetical protein
VNLLLELLQINESSDDNLEAFYHGLPKEGSYGSVLAAHAIAKLMNGIEQDGIYNTDYSDAKERLNRILEKRAEGLYGKLNQETRMEMYQKFNYGGILYLHALKRPIQAVHSGIQSKVNNKATEEDMDKLHELLKVLQAAEKIGEMIKKLKPKVIKGRKPTIPDPNEFRSKLGSKEAQHKVQEHLAKGIKEPLDDMEEGIRDWIQTIIDDLIKDGTTNIASHAWNPRTEILHRCFEYKHRRDHKTGSTEYSNLKITEKGKDYAVEEAKKQRDALETHFMSKNTLKLSQIVDQKGNLEGITELPSRPATVRNGLGTIEAGFKFDFTDGSSFTVINKAVQKRSFQGKDFYQFPTTFHQVKMPDGTSLKTPSEEKMVKEFSVAVPKVEKEKEAE